MKYATVILFLLPLSVLAGPKDCNELVAEIESQLAARGVAAYRLEIVPAAQVEHWRRDRWQDVGSCENGTKKIVYRKVAAGSRI